MNHPFRHGFLLKAFFVFLVIGSVGYAAMIPIRLLFAQQSFTLSSDKTQYFADDPFTLTISGAPANAPVEFLWWKNGTVFDGGCGAGNWCPIGGNTSGSGFWSVGGNYTSSLAGTWRERAKVGDAISNDIEFTVSTQRSTVNCSVLIKPTSINLNQSASFTYSSSPTGYHITLFQKKDGNMTMNGADYGWTTNFNQQPWTPTQTAQAGTYETWFQAKDASGNVVCTSQTATLIVYSADPLSDSCTLSADRSIMGLGQAVTFSYASVPAGYRIYAFGKKDGVYDLPVGGYDLQAFTNHVQAPWTPTLATQVGTYERWFEARNASGGVACTSNHLNLQVQNSTAQGVCVNRIQPSCAAPAGGCRTNARSNPGSYKQDVNADLGDYGAIFKDLGNPSCAAGATAVLEQKMQSTLANPSGYTTWLEGVKVSLIFSGAMRLGGAGTLTARTDGLVRQVRDRYDASHAISDTCGVTNPVTGDSCMDDYAIEGSAYGWIAAYEAKSGRAPSAFSSKAKNAISLTLSPAKGICLYRPAMPTACLSAAGISGGIAAALAANTVEATSYNHNQQNPTYGVGLMTSISSAVLGLEIAGDPYSPTNDERAIAMALLEDAQRKSLSDGSDFKCNCYDLSGKPVLDCGDKDFNPNYLPKMFPVSTFYRHAFGTPLATVTDPADGTTQTAFGFGNFDSSLFCDSDNFFHAGREVVYRDLTDSWWVNRPALNGFTTVSQQVAQDPVLTANKSNYLVEESFVLNVENATPNSIVEFRWWKNGAAFDGGCGAGNWCRVGSMTDTDGSWTISGKYLDVALVGAWTERVRIAGVESNVISFAVSAPTSLATCTNISGFASNCSIGNATIMNVPSVTVSDSLVNFPVTVSLPATPPNAIWNKGYYWSPTKNNWIEFTLTGTAYATGIVGWLKDYASASASVPKSDLGTATNYVVTWPYVYINGGWVGPSCSNVQGCWRLETFTLP